MEPVINFNETKRHYQEILTNAEHERMVEQFAGNSGRWVGRGLFGLGGILATLMAVSLYF